MNLLFTVCGRAGSKGLRNKNLKRMLNVPLLYYTLSAIDLYRQEYGAGDIIHTCINSDSLPLLELAERQSRVPLFSVEREAHLGGDTVAKTAVIQDCLQKADAHYGVSHELVIDLDITSPLREVADIRQALEKKRSLPQLDVIFSVVPSRRSPYFNMVRPDGEEGCTLLANEGYTARQQAPRVYDMNASIYVYERAFLLARSPVRLFDGKTGMLEMRDTAVLDIDSEEDFCLMELLAGFFLKDWPGLRRIYENAAEMSSCLPGQEI